MESHENMDKHLKQSLDGFSVPPKISSFDEILLKMEQRKKRRIFWFLFPGLVFLAGIMVFYLLPGKPGNEYSGHLKNKIIYTEPVTGPGSVNSKANEASSAGGRKTVSAEKPEISNKKEETQTTDRKTLQPGNNQKENQSPQGSVITDRHLSEQNNDASAENTRQDIPAAAIAAINSSNEQDTLPEAEKLEPVTLRIPYEPVPVEAKMTFQFSSDSVLKPGKKSALRFFRGISFEPQLNSYLLSENNNSHMPNSFREFYLKNRRDQNTVNFNYALGIKGGLVLKEKWEFQSGLGFQRFRYTEKVYPLETPAPTGPTPSGSGGSTTANPNSYKKGFNLDSHSAVDYNVAYINRFYYIWHTAEVAKYLTLPNLIKIKAGVGLRVNYLFTGSIINVIGMDEYDDYTYTKPFSGSPLLVNMNFKMGYIEDLGKRMQLQICPNMFYSLNSMFKKTHPIKQRAFGGGLECTLLFKLN